MNTAKPLCPPGLLLAFFPASISSSQACTIFCDSQDGVVLAGRNWDMIADGQPPVMWFVFNGAGG